jgi:DNA-binding NarL/FixJ family response regulator
MYLEVYIEKPMTRVWFQNIVSELGEIVNTNFHRDISNLMKRLDSVDEKQNLIIIIDVDSIHYNEITQQIKLYHPKLKLHAIGSPMKIEDILVLFKKGFYSFNELGESSIEIYNALKQTSYSKRHLSSDKMNELIFAFINGNNSELESNSKSIIHNGPNNLDFTKKQKEVCDYLVKGYTYKEIASFLGITTFTVNQRAKSIYKKLKVKSRNELAYLYLN